ncbi:MAG: FKBP-type peptidyl-prolyl cis-trans isomerase [Crocinitomicaceae bacterium]|nr:FKBP-type peptidyl-prolyl cis-trans isomerase [Crocinitomicaceae bacterium]
MIKYSLYLASIVCISAACTTTEENNGTDTSGEDGVTITSADSTQMENVLDGTHEVENERELASGIRIQWFEHGTGDLLENGEMVQIDYKVLLEDGSEIDGNHLIGIDGKESVPFVVGAGMQTPGWDMALKELRVGDFVEIFIPSHLARGEKSIEGVLPPNSNNILRIRILKKDPPTRNIEGNKVWLIEENSNNTLRFNETTEIEFHCMVSTITNPVYVNTYATNTPLVLRLEYDGMVPGLKKALINAKKSDRLFIYVPASEAYGTKGYQDLVKPNEDIFYNILVMDVRK